MDDKYIKETPEQLALIPIIRDEWIRIHLDTTPIDKQKAEAAICLAYECAELELPQQILWFDNPVDAINYVTSTYAVWKDYVYILNDKFVYDVRGAIWDAIWPAVQNAVGKSRAHHIRLEIGDDIWYEVLNNLRDIVFDAVGNTVWNSITDYEPVEDKVIILNAELVACYAYLDAIGVDCSKAKGLFATAKHCGWWWAFKDVAVAILKPSAIRLDERGRLHAEGVPAVVYQGFNVYAYHGVRLPEKYGSIHPEQWQSQWLLEEDNAELKRVLIQGISYDRICQELQAIELDSWQEYTLLRIDSNIDVEPIYLLKMTCPSTGYIHALRVPPDVVTARDAITWVNWGIAPEEFAVQT